MEELELANLLGLSISALAFSDAWVGLIFVRVNQVLLRLWARSKGCLRVMRGLPITATV